MLASLVPLVTSGSSDPLVGEVRLALNLPGDDCLDTGLSEVIRGYQRARGIPAHGLVDEQLLEYLEITL